MKLKRLFGLNEDRIVVLADAVAGCITFEVDDVAMAADIFLSSWRRDER
jgi:hypothetical protein